MIGNEYSIVYLGLSVLFFLMASIFYLLAFFEAHPRARHYAFLFIRCGFIVATVFFGGWQVPGLQADGWHLWGGEVWAWPHWLVVVTQFVAFCLKVFFLCFLQLAIRWTVPRMRYDQLMKLGWKGMLPASIANVVITAALVLWSQAQIVR